MISHSASIARTAISICQTNRNPLRLPAMTNDAKDRDPSVAAAIAARGTPAEAIDGTDAIVARLCEIAQPGDVALVMSNGDFDGIHDKLLAALTD